MAGVVLISVATNLILMNSPGLLSSILGDVSFALARIGYKASNAFLGIATESALALGLTLGLGGCACAD